ncbi:hypothetical protein Pmani_003285 [Petrolisthes manimaculis]|uniref:C2H2-type domain-containing protein n=1 Tax=Petrolisthes manimaculis TaxID=1843537 RepID=A0AAE1QG57_9EUCA|nr:hypothetical protein Pmani_003285 [Petrolisthes manimaculis]
MATKVETTRPLIVVEETTVGECAIFNDCEDNEEKVLYINSDKQCSTSCQTDVLWGDAGDGLLGASVPILFCVQLGPNSASTQCFIPAMVSVGVGTQTDYPGACPNPHPDKYNHPYPDNGKASVLYSSNETRTTGPRKRNGKTPVHNTSKVPTPSPRTCNPFTDNVLGTNESLGGISEGHIKAISVPDSANFDTKPALPLTDKGVISPSVKCEVILEISESDAVHSEGVAAPLVSNTAKVKKKRGRKRKIETDISTKTYSDSKSTFSNSQTKPNTFHTGKRKRKRKMDTDYEYNLSGSDDQVTNVDAEYDDDDRDVDYKADKGVVYSDDENIETPDPSEIKQRKSNNRILRKNNDRVPRENKNRNLKKNKNKTLVTAPVKIMAEVENNEDYFDATTDSFMKEEAVENNVDSEVGVDVVDNIDCFDAATNSFMKEEEADNNVDSEGGVDDVGVEFDDMLSEFGDECDVDSDEDDEGEGPCDDAGTPSAGREGTKKNVLTVGINDLDVENDQSKRLKKYLAKAKEKYHQEKIVNKDGKVIYKCLKCNEEFKMRLQLKEHRKVHSNKVRIYDCSHCDKVFTEARKYYSHLAFHDRLFECRLCGRRFSLLRNLKKHLTIHKGAPNQVCEICGSQFSTVQELTLHHDTQHKEDSIKPYKIECEHCGRKYVREEAYQQHISKAPYKCSSCDASMGCEFKLKDHVRFQHGRCICEFCGKSFKKHSLLHHIKVIHREGCVQCPHCPKKFAYRSKMLAHLDANHTDEKKYKCNHCSYTARTVNTLNIHRRKYHSEPGTMPSYPCNQCGRKFTLPSKLTLHYRIHTGERPFKCRSCGKDFASKYNMAEHERCVHGEKVKLVHPDGTSSVRVVKHRRFPRAPGRRCDLCGLHLPSSSAVLTHMKQHHNAQAVSSISLIPDNKEEGSGDEIQVAEIELNRDNYEATPTEQFEVIENTEQDLILTAPTGMVTIPDYATHVEINGVEYQANKKQNKTSFHSMPTPTL